VSTKMIQATLHNDLKLFKRSARWVPNLPDKEMKKEQMRVREAIVAMIISVNILSVVEYVEGEEEAVEYVEGEEEAGWLHLTQAGGGYEKSHSGGLHRGSAAVIRVLREVMQIHGGHIQKN
jgi:hypothetical protein